MLFEDNILRKTKRKTSEKAKIEALFKASVKNNVSKRKGNLRHPSCL